MKKLLIVLTAAALTLGLCACSGGTGNNTSSAASTESAVSADSAASADSASGSLQAALEKVKAEVTFPGETSDFTAKRIQRTLGITEEQMEEFAGMYCNDGVTQDQVIYIKAKNDSDVQDIQNKLQANLDSIYAVIKNYTPEQVEMIQKATVDTNGRVVCLVISDKADDIKKIFNNSLQN